MNFVPLTVSLQQDLEHLFIPLPTSSPLSAPKLWTVHMNQLLLGKYLHEPKQLQNCKGCSSQLSFPSFWTGGLFYSDIPGE